MAYTPKTWVTGETIEATELNHMEQGIAAISADGAIGTQNLAGDAVTSEKIANGAIGTNKLADGAVTNDELDQDAVDSNNIRAGAVTLTKLGADVIAELDNKANIDGSYESMTVGNAEQLVSTVGVEDSAPYTFRTTGGSADVGDRLNLKAVVGGTVAWNQFALYDESTPSNGWTSLRVLLSISGRTMTITSTVDTASTKGCTMRNFETVSGHKYYLSGYVTPPQSYNAIVGFYTSGGTAMDRESLSAGSGLCDVSRILSATADGGTFRIGPATSAPNGTAMTAKDIMLTDLTAMFGSAIADYVYTLESGSAGAGIAWLKKYGYFTKPYYSYAAASLQSVKTSAHKTIGFNQCNDSIHSGHFWTAGTLETNKGANYAAIDSKIRAIPNTQYCVYIPDGTNGSTLTGYLNQWDAVGNYIGAQSASIGADNLHVFTTAANVAEIAVSFYRSGGATTGERICVNLSWDGEKDGEYAPFEQHTYALDDVELRGIPKLDANNNLYYDGDTYEADGTVTRKYGTRAYTSGDATDGSTMITDGTNTVYKLTTPTTESADDYTELQVCDDFGTEEFTDAATRDFDMPVGHNTVYQPNLRAKLEMAPDSPDGDGDYIVRQTNGQNSYIPLVEVKELPNVPSNDGFYKLRCTVTDGTPTLSWISDS